MDDLQGFERLITNYDVKWQMANDNFVIKSADNWNNALQQFWSVPIPRIIRATFVDGKWVFAILGGSGVRLVAIPDMTNIIFLRFKTDSTHIPPDVGNTLDSSNFGPPARSVTSGNSFYGHIVSMSLVSATGNYVSCLNESTMPTNLSDDRTLFRFVVNEGPVPVSEVNLDGGTKMKTVARCRVSLQPYLSKWQVPNVDPNNLQIFQLNGDTRIAPSIQNGWNLHAYGWMIQTAANFNTPNFLMLKTNPLPYVYIGCFDVQDGKRQGFSNDDKAAQNPRYVSLCAARVNGISKVFGLEQTAQCWWPNGKGDFYDAKNNKDTDKTAGCTYVDNRGFPAGDNGKMSIYQSS